MTDTATAASSTTLSHGTHGSAAVSAVTTRADQPNARPTAGTWATAFIANSSRLTVLAAATTAADQATARAAVAGGSRSARSRTTSTISGGTTTTDHTK
ncbi:hypothetical protein OHA72_51740 [Dactylosporangium sp. NBC_01737]|uniref:hypothetical protein n=1 Tax=Dactylosporangium sp. NBC_01737 TaxID=2975959 RepID=UPI002E0E8632|nr:hypothetical protein OHA72_51740 [Dactylosporangium sp. NBC_01737]